MWREEIGITEMMLSYIGEFTEFRGWSSYRSIVIDILACHEAARRQKEDDAEVHIIKEDVRETFKIAAIETDQVNSASIDEEINLKEQPVYDRVSAVDEVTLFPPIEIEDVKESSGLSNPTMVETSTRRHAIPIEEVKEEMEEMNQISTFSGGEFKLSSIQINRTEMEYDGLFNVGETYGSSHNLPNVSKNVVASPMSPSAEICNSLSLQTPLPMSTADGNKFIIRKPTETFQPHNAGWKRSNCCRFCGKQFKTCSAKISHERIHTGEKPFSCSYCGRSFTQVSHKRNHERIHNSEKPFQCSYCDRSFCRNEDRQTHERTHTGEKPYTCSYCFKSLSSRRQKRSHERIHTGEKNFVCAICSKSFATRSAKQRHERIHTGSKPFECRFCPRTFSELYRKTAHESTHSQT